MNTHAEAQPAAPERYRDLSRRRERASIPRTGYVLAVSGALAVVTFVLVYLTTLSYVTEL